MGSKSDNILQSTFFETVWNTEAVCPLSGVTANTMQPCERFFTTVFFQNRLKQRTRVQGEHCNRSQPFRPSMWTLWVISGYLRLSLGYLHHPCQFGPRYLRLSPAIFTYLWIFSRLSPAISRLSSRYLQVFACFFLVFSSVMALISLHEMLFAGTENLLWTQIFGCRSVCPVCPGVLQAAEPYVDCRNSYAWESDTEPLYTNTFLNIYMCIHIYVYVLKSICSGHRSWLHSGHTAYKLMTERSHRFLQQAMQTTKHDCTNRWNMAKLNKFCNFTLKTIYSSKPKKSWLFKKQKNHEKNAKIQAIWSNTSKTTKKISRLSRNK